MNATRRLSSGLVAIVDDEDAALLNSSGWYGAGYRGHYVGRTVMREGKKTTEYLHRIIAAAGEAEVDHINGNPLDNRRSNLRITTRGENERAKQRPRPENTTGVRGVEWTSRGKKRFRAVAWEHGKRLDLGHYLLLEEAEAAVAQNREAMLAHLIPVGGE